MTIALGTGIVLACILALPTLGFNLNLAVSNVVNISFVVNMALGTFLTYVFETALGMDLAAAAVLAVAVAGLVSLLSWRCLAKPFLRRGSSPVTIIIVLFALYTVVDGVLAMVFGENSYAFATNGPSPVLFTVGAFQATTIDVLVVVTALLLVGVIHVILEWTPFGRSVRAIADDESLARLSGCKVDRVVDATWFIAGALGGLSGVLFGLLYVNFDVNNVTLFFLLILASAFAGGAGRPLGSVIGAAVVGIGTQLLSLWIEPVLAPVAGLMLLCVTIIVRPGGVLGFFRQEVRA